MEDGKIKRASATILFTSLSLLSFFIAGDSPPPYKYKPIDDIALDCGSSHNSNEYGGTRTWAADINSNFFPSDLHRNSESVTSSAQKQFPLVTDVPYVTARLSRSEFTYTFPVSPGQKFVRLYFYSAPYPNFDRSKAVFTITAGIFTLLRDFNASVNADVASDSKLFFREYCVYVDGNDNKLNLTFTPTNMDSYAFISGIEIVSMPINLYYTPLDPNDQGDRGLKQIGQDNRFFPIENYTSLEMVYRMNIGGNVISPSKDTGMFRTWSEEKYLLDGNINDATPFNLSIHLNYTKIPPYTAPEDVYRFARTMGQNYTLNKSYNLTWEYPVDPGFFYMLRLHFCEFEAEINDTSDRVFLIYIEDMIAEQSADVFRWAGGKYIPIHRDYVVNVRSSNREKKVNLSVKLQANPNDFLTRFTNVILNGIEIFKLNDSSGNLAGQDPDLPPNTPTQSLPQHNSQSKNSKSKKTIIIVVISVGGVVAILALCVFTFRRCRTLTDKSSSDGTSRRALHSMSTNKSSRSGNSNLPSNLCHYFSILEIKAATKDFDDGFIIGIGGFGNVYKGYMDDGATPVAIKRLKPGSKQGENEFMTEIEMLSQLRHLHLVSLIGYCNDEDEMILVYDYMSHGTLRSHLICGSDYEQPLTWKQRLQICIGAAKGLDYLHTDTKHTIIHRDVKTTNILLDENWVAKVSDFGLSKVGPTNMSKAHISTVVKGSFGYLDPEYCRRQHLTEKSDVYSFGVVLCEVLCARPALIRIANNEMTLLLAELVRRCYREKTVHEIIDPNIKNEIAPECFRKFIEIAVSCIQGEGNKRPSMKDVVWGLEFASQLQSSSKKGGDEVSDTSNKEGWNLGEAMFSNSTEIEMRTNSSGENSRFVYNNGMSGIVFSELEDLQGR